MHTWDMGLTVVVGSDVQHAEACCTQARGSHYGNSNAGLTNGPGVSG